jgi:uroporphyrin-III C-methyltransferase
MTEHSNMGAGTNVAADVSPHPAQTPPAYLPPPASQPNGWLAPLALALSVLAVAAALLFGLNAYTQMRTLEVLVAQRITQFDTASHDARAAAKAANDALADLQNRLGSLEARNQDTQNQQLALNAMYQELANSADERVVADIEQTLLLAQQQLQLAGNIKAALIGLEAAEVRLAKLGKSQFDSLRHAIVQDMERLKLMPAADISSVNARLETLIQNVDGLKFESEAEPLVQATTPTGTTATASTATNQQPLHSLEMFSKEIWNEIKSLLRIRRLDHPELPLLTPSQRYFLHQNLKLRLLAARIAMLQRDESTFRADVLASQNWVNRYFNLKDPATQAFASSLGSLLKAPVALNDAEIKASLKALQALRKDHE